MKHLAGLYTLDFRRLKGALTDYKENHVSRPDDLRPNKPLADFRAIYRKLALNDSTWAQPFEHLHKALRLRWSLRNIIYHM